MSIQNPFRSRSTLIALACIAAFLCLSALVLKAGYFNDEYALTGLMFLSTLSGKMLDHQRSSDSDKTKSEQSIK